jgi:hypothetical protein
MAVFIAAQKYIDPQNEEGYEEDALFTALETAVMEAAKLLPANEHLSAAE